MGDPGQLGEPAGDPSGDEPAAHPGHGRDPGADQHDPPSEAREQSLHLSQSLGDLHGPAPAPERDRRDADPLPADPRLAGGRPPRLLRVGHRPVRVGHGQYQGVALVLDAAVRAEGLDDEGAGVVERLVEPGVLVRVGEDLRRQAVVVGGEAGHGVHGPAEVVVGTLPGQPGGQAVAQDPHPGGDQHRGHGEEHREGEPEARPGPAETEHGYRTV
ncbi:hypothetical protein [Streptomyces spongiicola]|uniref:hypothetical protein n=1 Tax=Streptomyces spongiicola TaxID=1690221 RepID=UPI0021D05BB9|nr:hypothetical protein [Streptomyces spongiicola]